MAAAGGHIGRCGYSVVANPFVLRWSRARLPERGGGKGGVAKTKSLEVGRLNENKRACR